MKRNPFNPVWVARRLAYKVYERRHPDEPWLAQTVIRWLDENLPRAGVGIEWGGGRSTQWFGRRLARLVTVEESPEWAEQIRAQTVELESVDLRQASGEAAYVGVVAEAADESLDFALVDGGYREACIRAVVPKLKRGGLLTVDNTDWPADWPVPAGWPVVAQGRNVMTETTVWRKP